ncbi:MAG TPA: c-type cytochrome [Gemmatimonadales bacterium]|nr:c-type cytochrome [Gemmatimonadales bacterium]
MRRGSGVLLVALAFAACKRAPPKPAAGPVAPADSQIPAGPLGDAIRRGQALLLATRDSLPAHVGNKLRCVSCHLDEGRRPAGTWVGAYGRYPQYRARSGTVESIEFRVNDCFLRSLNGAALDPAGKDMRDIVAYLAFLSWGTPAGLPPAKKATPFDTLTPDTARGRAVFAARCAKCHGPDGQGLATVPPLWGPGGYNIGAGMSRVRTAAAFVRANMPYDQPGILSDQEALDVAAFVDGQPRPDFTGKEHDWPKGGAPPDVAYSVLSAARKPAPARPR